MQPPRAFISYSHDSAEHLEWVRKLASDLRVAGVDAILHVWDPTPGKGFIEEAETALRRADGVIVVCTPRYREVAERRRAGGVGDETGLTSSVLYGSDTSARVVPILRVGEGPDAVPDWLLGREYIDLRNDWTYVNNFKRLLEEFLSPAARKQSAPSSIAEQQETSSSARIRFTVETVGEHLDKPKLSKLKQLLQSYFGRGITIKDSQK